MLSDWASQENDSLRVSGPATGWPELVALAPCPIKLNGRMLSLLLSKIMCKYNENIYKEVEMIKSNQTGITELKVQYMK